MDKPCVSWLADLWECECCPFHEIPSNSFSTQIWSSQWHLSVVSDGGQSLMQTASRLTAASGKEAELLETAISSLKYAASIAVRLALSDNCVTFIICWVMHCGSAGVSVYIRVHSGQTKCDPCPVIVLKHCWSHSPHLIITLSVMQCNIL